MQLMQNSSLLFGANAPFIEELYEHYLADPAGVPHGVAQLLRRAAAAGQRRPRRVAQPHPARPLRHCRKAAAGSAIAPDRRPGAQAGLRAAAHQCAPLPRRARRRPRSAEAPRKPVRRRSSIRRTTASPRPTWTPTFDTGSFWSAPERHDAARDHLQALQETYCGTHRRRVHVHHRRRRRSAGSSSGSRAIALDSRATTPD